MGRQRPGSAGQSRLLRPGLPFGIARRRAAEQDCGVEGHPFGADVTENPFQLLRRARVIEERAVPYLDAVPVIPGQAAQKPGESAEIGRAEGRRQLDPEGAGPFPERLDRGQERAEQVIGSSEPVLMGDRPRQLEYKPKIRRGLLGPRFQRVRRGSRIKGGVAFDCVAPGRVGAEAVAR
jgi:hypothetical protein